MTTSTSRLADWAVSQVGATSQRRLYLRCTNSVAAAVERRLATALRARIRLPPSEWDEWTHRYPLTRPLTVEEEAFLEALRRAVNLWLPPPVTTGIALDLYQDPTTSSDPVQWQKTRLGQLVHDGKYHGSASSLGELAQAMAAFMDAHPALAECEIIVGVPSHSPQRFSERLATAVGHLRAVPVVMATDNLTAPIKELPPEGRPQQSFVTDTAAIAGRKVVIVDDLVRSGASVLALARHLEATQAASISVLAAVRTMRN